MKQAFRNKNTREPVRSREEGAGEVPEGPQAARVDGYLLGPGSTRADKDVPGPGSTQVDRNLPGLRHRDPPRHTGIARPGAPGSTQAAGDLPGRPGAPGSTQAHGDLPGLGHQDPPRHTGIARPGVPGSTEAHGDCQAWGPPGHWAGGCEQVSPRGRPMCPVSGCTHTSGGNGHKG